MNVCVHECGCPAAADVSVHTRVWRWDRYLSVHMCVGVHRLHVSVGVWVWTVNVWACVHSVISYTCWVCTRACVSAHVSVNACDCVNTHVCV